MLSDVLESHGGSLEDPMYLYTDMFRLGEGLIQCEGEPPGKFKANPIIIGHSGGEGGRAHRKILFEDTFAETLSEFQAMDWAFLSPCTYFGRKNSAERQSKLCALVFDLDEVDDSHLTDFFFGMGNGVYPRPTHVVLSGHGVHLYYVLDEPLDLYPNIKTQVKELKYALTRRIWNRYTSRIKDPQYQGINQAFRIPGSRTKEGAPIERCEAYLFGPRVSIEELNGFVNEGSQVDVEARYPAARMTLAEARERYPDWYRRVTEGEPRGQWVARRDLLEWWVRKAAAEATYGHRYFCVMALAVFAAKCGVYDHDEVKGIAMSLVPHMNRISDHPFTEADVDSALECLDSRYATFPRSDLERLTAIPMPPNKRNGRPQSVHLAVARAVQGVVDPDATWRNVCGAPEKKELVRTYTMEHPDANHSEIARALGVSRPTVIKWLRPGWEEED